MIKITLPLPPSANIYYRSIIVKNRVRVVISKNGRKFKDDVNDLVVASRLSNSFSASDRLKCVVNLFPRDRRSIDIDNRLKSLLDALEGAGVFPNDSQIDHLLVHRGDIVKGGGCTVELSVIDNSLIN